MRTAFFHEGPAGPLYCAGFLHDAAAAERRRFIILAPFGEEMNKSRHVLAALCRVLGAAGHDVLLPDLYGTGDSAGDFGDASIDTWRADIDSVIERIAANRDVELIGLRFGALLAADALRRHRVRSLTLIHPLAQGQQQMNQLLRLRLAAGLIGPRSGETAAGLREQLSSGESLEIAGYRISPAMAKGLGSLSLEQIDIRPPIAVNWLELVVDSERPLMPVSQRIIDRWRTEGIDVTTQTLVCDSFWATQEIAYCPALAQRLAGLLREDVDGR